MLLQYDVLFHITVCGSSVSLVWSCCPCYCGTMNILFHITVCGSSVSLVWSCCPCYCGTMNILFHITVCGSSVSLVWSCCLCYCGMMFYYFILQYVEVQSVWYGAVVHVTAVRCSIISHYSMWKFSQFGMELLSMLLQYDVLLFHITVCGSSASLVWSCCPCYCGMMFYYFILQYVEVQPVWYGAVVHVTVV